MKHRPLITLTTNFGVQSQGVGLMEAVAFSIAPQARVIHLMHGLPAYNLLPAARTLETIQYIPVGQHVCVVDPGVGTRRKAIVLQVGRGDYLIGPDNGVLIPASRILGGIKAAHELQNPDYMRKPVSAIFHGRDIFTPAAAHLANGVHFTEFGPAIGPQELMGAPYDEAKREREVVHAQVIHINRFGSLHLNITHEQWDSCDLPARGKIQLTLAQNRTVSAQVVQTFGDAATGEVVILKDDAGRVTVAKNMGSFNEQYQLEAGDTIAIDLHVEK